MPKQAIKPICLTVTPGLLRAIDRAAGGESRNAAIENWLWRIPEILKAAAVLDIERQPRRPVGRPGKNPTGGP